MTKRQHLKTKAREKKLKSMKKRRDNESFEIKIITKCVNRHRQCKKLN